MKISENLVNREECASDAQCIFEKSSRNWLGWPQFVVYPNHYIHDMKPTMKKVKPFVKIFSALNLPSLKKKW